MSFEVADESIAAVTPTGVVVGKAEGTTTVSVYRQNPETYEPELIATVTVNVSAPEPEPEPVADTFEIVFSLGGGTINGSSEDIHLQCKLGDIITIPEAPIRDGYTFLYWKGSKYYPGDSYEVVGNHEFTAEWEQNAVPNKDKTAPNTGDGTPLALIVAVAVLATGAAVFARRRSNAR